MRRHGLESVPTSNVNLCAGIDLIESSMLYSDKHATSTLHQIVLRRQEKGANLCRKVKVSADVTTNLFITFAIRTSGVHASMSAQSAKPNNCTVTSLTTTVRCTALEESPHTHLSVIIDAFNRDQLRETSCKNVLYESTHSVIRNRLSHFACSKLLVTTKREQCCEPSPAGMRANYFHHFCNGHIVHCSHSR